MGQASTATALSAETITGLSSIRASGRCLQRRGDAARSAAAAIGGAQGRAAPRAIRASVGGQRDHGDVVERLGVDAAERRRRAPARAPSRRTATSSSAAGVAPSARRASAGRGAARRLAIAALVVQVERRTPPSRALWRSRAGRLIATGPPSSRQAATASSRRVRPSVGTGDAGVAQQRLGLVLVEPSVLARRPRVRRADRGDARGVRRGRQRGMPRAARPAIAAVGDRASRQRRAASTSRVHRPRARSTAVEDSGPVLGPSIRPRRRARAPGRSPGRSRGRSMSRGRASRARPRAATCSRAGCRAVAAAGRTSPRARAVVSGASGGQRHAELGREVGRDRRVAAGAGHDRHARRGARPHLPSDGEPPHPASGERLRQLEQLVRVLGPRRAELLEQRAEDALVAGERARVGDRRGRAGPRAARLEHRDADARARAALRSAAHQRRAVAVGLEVERDRAHAVALGERLEEVRRRRAPPGCRTRRPCAGAARAARRAR